MKYFIFFKHLSFFYANTNVIYFRYAIYLERLEGRFTVDTTMDRPALHHADDHQHLFNDTLDPSINIDSSWAAWKGEVAKWPWRCLRHLELKGRINLRVLQLLVGSADLLQTLNVTNWPNEMVSGGMALDDTWLAGIVEANGLHNLKELTLRMESEHYVEEGFMTKTSLATFLNYAVDNCPKLEKIVGEWTKIPDRLDLEKLVSQFQKSSVVYAVNSSF